MSTAIWLLSYGLADHKRNDYLQWFHDVHIVEKLARAGYTWAAHYRLHAASTPDPRQDNRHIRYIAMFGGETPRVFLDPSPAQLKLRQSGLTRDMMDCRIDGRSTVYCEEWASGGSVCGRSVAAACIRVEFFDAKGHDEDLASWCAQEHMTYFADSDACAGSRKMIASAGTPRHCVLHEFDNVAAAQTIADSEPASEWRARIEGSIARPLGAAVVAERLWPPLA